MIPDRTWFTRRGIAVLLLVPGYCVGYVASHFAPILFPYFDWNVINPYTIGAIGSTVFNTLMWDRFVKWVYRYSSFLGKSE